MKGYEIFQDAHNMYCVYEYLAGGDLSALRSNAMRAGVVLTEEYFQPIFMQCLMGLKQLHHHAILHCDIKEPNIMIRNSCYKHPQCVLIDVGLSVQMVGDGKSGGTPGYRPPEVIDSNIWSPKGDVFSMGVVFFQLMADLVPDTFKRGIFQRNTEKGVAKDVKQCNEITKTRLPPIRRVKEKYPDFDETWLMKMLDKNRENRPSPAMLLDDYAWFKVDIPQCTEGCSIKPPPEPCSGECFAGCSVM